MKKYEILNEIDHNANEYENIPLDDEQVKRYRVLIKERIGENSMGEGNLKNYSRNNTSKLSNKRKKSKNKLLSILAASVALVLVISLTPIGATMKQGFEAMSIKVYELLGMNQAIQKYSNAVGQSVSNKNVKVILGEVIIEEGTLDVLYEYEYLNKDEAGRGGIVDVFIYKNGKMISTGLSGFEENKGKKNIAYLDITVEGEIKNGDVLEFEFKEESTKIGEISFKVDNDVLVSKTKTIAIDKKINIDKNNFINIDRFTYNDLSKRLYVRANNNLLENYEFFVIAKNKEGKEAEIELREFGDGKGRLQANYENDKFFEENKEFSLELYVKKGGLQSGEFKRSDYKKVGESIDIKMQ